MARFNCFSSLLIPKKKKSDKPSNPLHVRWLNNMRDLRAKPELVHPLDKGTKEASFEVKSPLTKLSKSKDGALTKNPAVVEAAYEGGDEHDDVQSIKKDFSVIDLHALAGEKGELESPDFNHECSSINVRKNNSQKNEGITSETLIESGHVSDPGMGKTMSFGGSPLLKRSCSMIERKRNCQLPPISPSKSHSYGDLKKLSGHGIESHDILGSPLSVVTSCSADKVILKKKSSSQVLPSRSRKLWWKLFLWSHRNLHRISFSKPERKFLPVVASNQKDGYCSDTLQSSPTVDIKKKKPMEEPHVIAGLWPQNQWVAFCAESSLDRVSAWVHSLEDGPFFPTDNDDISAGANGEIAMVKAGEHSQKNHAHTSKHASEEIVQANNIIKSLNSLHSVAHISGMGLKVIPAISAFTSLREVNLSNNFIVRISHGSLPKSLHTLDLSRNKISAIEGLKQLTKLRLLNLSYNRISHIGHGLSNCIIIKELYLVGNKISEVEGLHRLLKLSVLDLSFNKITTANALGQLVANYNSLLALNLLGNPIQTHIGDDQLQKFVCSLLPHLVYLNKQPTKPHRSREAVTDNVAKAALGSIGWNSRKRPTRHAVLNLSSPTKGITNGSEQKNKRRSKSRRQHSFLTRK
ncbi:uncharacterized protein LOC122008973 [Zingiber officinale]|uniref:Leucine-rich repeat family protein n=1 Tax=Zingiber officinale TaxID=94328 RepID=A0A8J5KRP9_ZINOF|nr:uncharacterized protein LOC122008973 [Zingiber officinale]XP_042420852.1 uncharacterized protein LOC122008973 [Zingiber officinale]KAG6486515.1 hypothetical protein ZIOFF_055091 [Zingiber officinale]